jgi:mannosyltransferase
VASLDLRRGSRLWVLAPLAAGALAAALGLLLLGRKSLSTDEAFEVSLARRTLADVLDDAGSRLGSSAHLLLIHPIARVNDAEWAVRAPSVVAIVLAAALLYVLGARLFGRLAGAVAGGALALHAGVVATSQLAQPYALAVFGVVLSTLLFVVALERGSAGWAVAYALSVALLPFLHPAATSIVAAQLVAAVVRDRRPSLTLLASAAGCAVAVPVLVVVGLDRSDGNGALDLGDLAEGVAHAAGWNPVLVALAALGVVFAAVRLREAALWKALLVGGLVLAPVVALLLAALVVTVFPNWALVVAAPGLALGVGAGVAGLAGGRALVAAGAVGAVAAVALVFQYRAEPAEDWRAAARAAELVRKPGETVVVTPDRARPAFEYYAPDMQTSRVARGDAAWVLVPAPSPEAAIELGRSVVPTPRYALRRQFRYGDALRLQHWIRP